MLRYLIKNLYRKYRNLILYGIIGSCSSGLDFLLYTLFVNVFNWHYLFSNCVSVLAGITTSFTLNRTYNFKVKDQTIKRMLIFFTVGLCGMLMSNLILYVCIDCLEMNKIVSKLLSIGLVVIAQFVINKYITFRPTSA
ncbi:Putative flippase GtrA (transmembrane translocase of bactoprenol-linked glucose) [Xylanibacter ruminicola]|uniref:Putative flippase GtrA (Transmembrane translocase of bactoprenol-linked glucose) n=1 Tax=Xylanibacter ruminicola TaxID=839 RepID=A0A1H5UCH2_XYLRU|nr:MULTISPECIES: GtrA family protein [Prevotellaceae]MCR5469900.1 GtrA family protein [Prevotella sp.]SEF72011.1 Putative flippase GtrA (transmembrane translocase of bactoprenol-linked glucose) [Xylanibacter ruminicola]SEV85419.1 Putative flippase GtrA (transmembrane translocase of bactoprenol-linked glucose) [Prevotella sp. khp7]